MATARPWLRSLRPLFVGVVAWIMEVGVTQGEGWGFPLLRSGMGAQGRDCRFERRPTSWRVVGGKHSADCTGSSQQLEEGRTTCGQTHQGEVRQGHPVRCLRERDQGCICSRRKEVHGYSGTPCRGSGGCPKTTPTCERNYGTSRRRISHCAHGRGQWTCYVRGGSVGKDASQIWSCGTAAYFGPGAHRAPPKVQARRGTAPSWLTELWDHQVRRCCGCQACPARPHGGSGRLRGELESWGSTLDHSQAMGRPRPVPRTTDPARILQLHRVDNIL